VTATHIQQKKENAVVTPKQNELFDFLFYLKGKLLYILIPALVCALVAGIYAFCFATPEYEATAKLYMVQSSDSVINLSDLEVGTYLTNDYQHVFETWEVSQEVIDHLQLPYTVPEMISRLAIQNPAHTRILLITFSSTDAQEAALGANEYAQVASRYISEQMRTNTPSIISAAQVPKQPVRPKKLVLITSALLIAASVAVWCLFIAFLFDDKIKTDADIKKLTGVGSLTVIPMAQSTRSNQSERR